MPSVDSLQISYQSNVVQAANADKAALEGAAAAMDSLAKSADTTDQTIKRATPSLDSLMNKLDGASAATARSEAAQRRYNTALDSIVAAEAKAGGATAQTTLLRQRAAAQLDINIAKAQDYGKKLDDSLTNAADGANKAAGAHAGFTRELIVLGHEVTIGNYSRIPGSLMVLAERSESATTAITNFGRSLLSLPTLATVAGLGALALATYNVLSRASELASEERDFSVALQATGRTAEITAGQLQGYAVALKAAYVSASDAKDIANQLARTQGLSSSQAAQVVSLTPNVATAMGVSDTDAAKLTADAVLGSADAIKKLDDALNILNPDEAAHIQQLLDQRDKAGAAAIAITELGRRVDGLRADSMSPLAVTFHDLGVAWDAFMTGIVNSRPVMAEIQGWTVIFNGLAGAMRGVSGEDISRQIVALNGQTLSLQGALSKMQSSGAVEGADSIQAQIDANNKQMDALIEKSRKLADAASAAVAAPPPGAVIAKTDPANIAAKALDTLAASRYNASTAGQAAKYTGEIKDFQAELATLGPRTSDNAARFDNLTGAIAADQDALEKLTPKVKDQTTATVAHASALEKSMAQLDTAISYQKALNAAYGKGGDAVQLLTAKQEAEKQVISSGLTPGMQGYATAVALATQKHLELNAATANTDLTKLVDDSDKATAATNRIAAAYDGTALSITHATDIEKARNALNGKFIEGSQAQTDAINKLAASYDSGAASALAFQQQQASVAALADAFKSAFDTIGNAITQAFISGQGAAVNWGNVMKGVITQVIQKIAELAILNPILNSIGIGNPQPTLGSALSTIANGRSGEGGTSSGGGLLSNVSNLYSTGKSLFTDGGSVFGSYTGSIDRIGTSIAPGAFNTFEPAAYAALPEGVSGPVAGASDVGYLGTSASGALGAIGGVTAGYGIGSYAGGLEQRALNKTGPGPQIGAGIGAAGLVAAAALAPETFGLSLIAAGLIGGTAGGLAGGLIGPHPQNSYSSTGLDTSGGLFSVGNSVYQQDANAGAEIQQLQQQVAALNAILTANGISVNSGHIQIGDNTPGGYQDPSKYSSLDSAVAGGVYKFSATDSTLNDKLSTKSFASIADFQTWITAFQATQASAKSFITDTTTLLKNFGVVNGQLGDSIDSITKQYTDTKAAADALIATGNLSEQQTSDMADAETRLATARDKAIAETNKAINQATLQTNQGLLSRYYNAQAAIGGPGAISTQNAALYAFDIQAQSQRTQLTASLVATFGTAFKDTKNYAAQMGVLETTLGEERLAIQKSYNDQITASASAAATTASGSITSITDYVKKFAVGSDSPLSPQAQYALASRQFDAVAGAAAKGDYTSTTQFTSYADSLAQAARVVYGSGAGYVAAVDRIEAAAGQIAAQGSDALTASVLKSETQTQTAVLSAKLDALTSEVKALRLENQQQSTAPARAA